MRRKKLQIEDPRESTWPNEDSIPGRPGSRVRLTLVITGLLKALASLSPLSLCSPNHLFKALVFCSSQVASALVPPVYAGETLTRCSWLSEQRHLVDNSGVDSWWLRPHAEDDPAVPPHSRNHS